MSDLTTAIELLAVGMITVFIILTLVAFLGRFIIFLVNRYHPEEQSGTLNRPSQANIPSKHIAVITAVVHKLTKGSGHLTHIEKYKK